MIALPGISHGLFSFRFTAAFISDCRVGFLPAR